jgi:hypothetical protein
LRAVTEHHFEPELAQPPPRPVQRRGGWQSGCGLWFLRLFLLPHTLAGVWLLAMATASTVLWVGVLLLGTEVAGNVVRKTEHRSRKGGVYREVEYSFLVDGVEYTGKVSPDADGYAALQEGQPITVRALPWAPGGGDSIGGFGRRHWPRMPGCSPFWDVTWFWFIALFWNGILSVFLWQAYVRPWFQRRLLRHGLPATGVVLQARSGTNRGTRFLRVRYEYTPAPGDAGADRLYAGSVTATGPGFPAFEEGDELTVLYDPRRPRRSVPYRLADYEVT